MMCLRNAVSDKPWMPIWDIRTRPIWVQGTVFDLMKQLAALRHMPPALPSIDTLNLPACRQLRVAFGDLDALCNAIVSAHRWFLLQDDSGERRLITSLQEYMHDHNGALGVGYGGPDDRGMLWIKFYKMLAPDRTYENHLQSIIWIDSLRPSDLAMAESSFLVRV